MWLFHPQFHGKELAQITRFKTLEPIPWNRFLMTFLDLLSQYFFPLGLEPFFMLHFLKIHPSEPETLPVLEIFIFPPLNLSFSLEFWNFVFEAVPWPSQTREASELFIPSASNVLSLS